MTNVILYPILVSLSTEMEWFVLFLFKLDYSNNMAELIWMNATREKVNNRRDVMETILHRSSLCIAKPMSRSGEDVVTDVISSLPYTYN